jgi:hypothetical protein
MPAHGTLPNGKSGVIGYVCASVELGGLLVREDVTMKAYEDTVLHLVSELEEIIVDRDPDPSLMRTPEDFRPDPHE